MTIAYKTIKIKIKIKNVQINYKILDIISRIQFCYELQISRNNVHILLNVIFCF